MHPMTPSVVTDDCIFPNTWHFHRTTVNCQAKRDLYSVGDEPAVWETKRSHCHAVSKTVYVISYNAILLTRTQPSRSRWLELHGQGQGLKGWVKVQGLSTVLTYCNLHAAQQTIILRNLITVLCPPRTALKADWVKIVKYNWGFGQEHKHRQELGARTPTISDVYS